MQYWLVKSEPSCYSIQDLKRDRKTAWTDVRNYQARNFLRAMKTGDIVLFYHSSCDLVGVVGEAVVVREAYPDPTQFEKDNDGYDQTATLENPRWSAVDISFKKQFLKTVSLTEIKTNPGLRSMTLIKPGNRLSVMPVTANEYLIIESLATS